MEVRVLEAGKDRPAFELHHARGREAVEVRRPADRSDSSSTHGDSLGVPAGDGVDAASS